MQRKLSGKHEDTDDELMEELSMEPIDDVDDKDFESDFEDLHETDEEIDDLYNARDIVMKRMVKDQYFNMDDKKWDDIVEDGVKHGFLMDTKECEEILEDMLSWDKLLPGIYTTHISQSNFHIFKLYFTLLCWLFVFVYINNKAYPTKRVRLMNVIEI